MNYPVVSRLTFFGIRFSFWATQIFVLHEFENDATVARISRRSNFYLCIYEHRRLQNMWTIVEVKMDECLAAVDRIIELAMSVGISPDNRWFRGRIGMTPIAIRRMGRIHDGDPVQAYGHLVQKCAQLLDLERELENLIGQGSTGGTQSSRGKAAQPLDGPSSGCYSATRRVSTTRE